MSDVPIDKELQWVYPKDNPEWRDRIVQEFHIHPVTAQILVSRGFETLDGIHAFLYSQLPELHDPQLFIGMSKAVERIWHALKHNEGILIYGDNDVDGMTGTALLTEFLRSIGGNNVFFFVANRSSQRQSLIVEALEYALENRCKLVITVDCGITAADEIAQMTAHNVDVIVTDHHEPTEHLPQCIATLNPKLINSHYPNRDLTGVGVAFKLAHALTNYLSSRGVVSAQDVDLKQYLDLVALGTISDMGALIGENRILVRYGLRQFQQTKRVGLIKLCDVCEVLRGNISATDIASKIAPRLNSLGRIDDPLKGVQLMLLRDNDLAEKMAKELDLNNIERQKIERTMSIDVESFIASHPEILRDRAIILNSDSWHPGVIAIVATRIAKQYNRPVAIIAVDVGTGKGSLRSMKEFPLLPALKQCSDYLLNFGGHDFAAGLTIKEEHISAFRQAFIKIANDSLSEEDVTPKLYIDAGVDFHDLTFDFMESLKLLEPFGNENPPPVLFADTLQAWPPKVVGKTHLKLYLEQNDRLLEGIAFNMAHKGRFLRRRNLSIRAAFTPQINTFQNKASIQLMIRDFSILAENQD